MEFNTSYCHTIQKYRRIELKKDCQRKLPIPGFFKNWVIILKLFSILFVCQYRSHYFGKIFELLIIQLCSSPNLLRRTYWKRSWATNFILESKDEKIFSKYQGRFQSRKKWDNYPSLFLYLIIYNPNPKNVILIFLLWNFPKTTLRRTMEFSEFPFLHILPNYIRPSVHYHMYLQISPSIARI